MRPRRRTRRRARRPAVGRPSAAAPPPRRERASGRGAGAAVSTSSADPLEAAQRALELEIPRLARLAVERAVKGKPASLLKAVRQMIREIAAERDRARQQTRPFIFAPEDVRLTPFEWELLRDLRRLLNPTGQPLTAEQFLELHRAANDPANLRPFPGEEPPNLTAPAPDGAPERAQGPPKALSAVEGEKKPRTPTPLETA